MKTGMFWPVIIILANQSQSQKATLFSCFTCCKFPRFTTCFSGNPYTNISTGKCVYLNDLNYLLQASGYCKWFPFSLILWNTLSSFTPVDNFIAAKINRFPFNPGQIWMPVCGVIDSAHALWTTAWCAWCGKKNATTRETSELPTYFPFNLCQYVHVFINVSW